MYVFVQQITECIGGKQQHMNKSFLYEDSIFGLAIHLVSVQLSAISPTHFLWQSFPCIWLPGV